CQPCFLQPHRLPFRQHAQRAAHFHPQRGNSTHHLEHFLKLSSLWSFPPRRPHTEPPPPPPRGFPRPADHLLGIEQPLPFHVRFVVRALRAVRAVLRASPGLDGNQLTGLHAIRWM